MNKIMFDLLMYVESGEPWNSRLIAQKLYKPYSVIDTEILPQSRILYYNPVFDSSENKKTLQPAICKGSSDWCSCFTL